MAKYRVTYSITHQAIEVTVDVSTSSSDLFDDVVQDAITDVSDKRLNHWLDKASLEANDKTCPECEAELNVVSAEWELVNIEEVPDGS